MVDERMDLSRGSNNDVIATDVRRRGQTKRGSSTFMMTEMRNWE